MLVIEPVCNIVYRVVFCVCKYVDSIFIIDEQSDL